VPGPAIVARKLIGCHSGRPHPGPTARPIGNSNQVPSRHLGNNDQVLSKHILPLLAFVSDPFDHFGLQGLPQHTVGPVRLIGAALLILGGIPSALESECLSLP
jgi:hypothetical protein